MDNSTIERLSMFVLDVLHDCEPVSSILDLLNNDEVGWREYWAHDFTEPEVLHALAELFNRELVEILEVATRDEHPYQQVLVPVQHIAHLPLGAPGFWFGRTALGQQIWDAWEPPELD